MLQMSNLSLDYVLLICLFDIVFGFVTARGETNNLQCNTNKISITVNNSNLCLLHFNIDTNRAVGLLFCVIVHIL